ncbi:MAG: 2-nitropropane dioxygenase [Azoarcus sp.]|nr:MAG: 2-nitropropane dioxygenase [Azoarcus sp.]TVT54047.1 MAG: nitronate monooxygenase [Azoarcus sp. PHD]
MTVQTHLGTALPIIQAPMAGVQGSALTIAVSNAGGLGSLACAMLTPDALLKELRAIKEGTDRPYNLNFFCHTQPEQSSEREQAWRATLTPYYAEFGIDPETIPSAAGREPFTTATADLIEPFKPPVISFHFGLPDPTLLARIKAWGTQVLSSATTVEEAQWLEAAGVDAVIAQGLEAGGHRGMFLSDDITTQTGTFALVRRIVRAVDIPVIAAGGVADAEGVAAAMTLGAAGVQIGTAYLLCPEASTSAVHRAALQSPDAAHTALTNLFSGRPARSIVNRFIAELGPLCRAAPAFPLASTAIAPLRAAAEALGSGAFSPLWCGQHPPRYADLDAASLTRALASMTQS